MIEVRSSFGAFLEGTNLYFSGDTAEYFLTPCLTPSLPLPYPLLLLLLLLLPPRPSPLAAEPQAEDCDVLSEGVVGEGVCVGGGEGVVQVVVEVALANAAEAVGLGGLGDELSMRGEVPVIISIRLFHKLYFCVIAKRLIGYWVCAPKWMGQYLIVWQHERGSEVLPVIVEHWESLRESTSKGVMRACLFTLSRSKGDFNSGGVPFAVFPQGKGELGGWKCQSLIGLVWSLLHACL